MRKTLPLLILGLAASSVKSACAGDNNLATLFGLTDLIDESPPASESPVSISPAMAVCGYDQSLTEVCCTEDQIVTGIQNYLDDLKGTLETAAGNRDKYIIKQRGEVIGALANLRRISAAADGLSDQEKLGIAAFLEYADSIAKDFADIVENFEDYQKARATCMDALIKTQAALGCAACKPDAPDGITLDPLDVVIDDTLVEQINDACFTYFTYSERQSYIITVSVLSAGLSNFASALEKSVAGDAEGAAADLLAAYTAFNEASYSGTTAEKAVKLPESCTETDCNDWIETILFGGNGILSQDAAILGGTALANPDFTIGRMLKEGNQRRLTAGGFEQDLDAITFPTEAFETNPGSVDNTENANSALRNGMTACAIAALALFF